MILRRTSLTRVQKMKVTVEKVKKLHQKKAVEKKVERKQKKKKKKKKKLSQQKKQRLQLLVSVHK